MASKALPLVAACLVAACRSSAPPSTPAPSSPSPASAAPLAPVARADPTDDDLLYLEDVHGERALSFARAHNAITEAELTAKPGFRALEARLLSIYGSKDKIPMPTVHGNTVRNFWTDEQHPRGLWRQTTLLEYKKASPAWTTLLDVDALNAAEGESFVFHGAICLYPRYEKCLIRLSRGGGDTEIVREFDVAKKDFVKGGFSLAEAKSNVSWKDEDTLFVAMDFGPESLTESGYPRVVKEWKRGAPLSDAKTIFEAEKSDVRAWCGRTFGRGRHHDVCSRTMDFEHQEVSILQRSKLVRLGTPNEAEVSLWNDDVFVRLKSDWKIGETTYESGSLLLSELAPLLAGKYDFQILYKPAPQTSLKAFEPTKNKILLNVMSDVTSKITLFSRRGTEWVGTALKEKAGSIEAYAFDDDNSDDAWVLTEDFTTPSTLSLWNTQTGERTTVKKNPSFFDASNLEVAQHFATSKDGTKIPYFEVRKKGRTSPGPTLLSAYGGFERSMTPSYSGLRGAAWLEKGGTFVLANLRGGGEYGPSWHKAAMKDKRQNAYDDLAAVAEDLIRRGVTTARSLGVMGGSNGGLLTSVMLTQRPELFGAIVSLVPLTDMKRYHKLLAGASWMSEYGDPDNPADWEALKKFSPLHNIRRAASYPPVLYTTSTKDDRVHPAHARKMVARLEALGHTPLYYENIEGGHGGAADLKQRAYVDALIYTFLASHLGL
ncbi:MAG: prolyl oligopeptidase family serine peptidase [Polyangiaceae bacterium]|nr:prolyl oligopeptidase family serine peptidase [Polyangiaceae bacterium]